MIHTWLYDKTLCDPYLSSYFTLPSGWTVAMLPSTEAEFVWPWAQPLCTQLQKPLRFVKTVEELMV